MSKRRTLERAIAGRELERMVRVVRVGRCSHVKEGETAPYVLELERSGGQRITYHCCAACHAVLRAAKG